MSIDGTADFMNFENESDYSQRNRGETPHQSLLMTPMTMKERLAKEGCSDEMLEKMKKPSLSTSILELDRNQKT